MSSARPRVKAIVLLSGGLDSATVLALALAQDRDVIALSFRYGQRHDREIHSATALTETASVEHLIVDIDTKMFEGSALTDRAIEVPKDSVASEEIPPTYVPARNLIFLSMATALAESRGADEIWIGANAIDYSGYPDCRPEFLHSFEETARLGTRTGIEQGNPTIVAPLVDASKGRIIRLGLEAGVDYGLTWSCYSGGETACGRCDSCVLRLKGFSEAGVEDPLRYEDR